jgi:predicted enzyme related to lactoylglutathione lyase/uncharacterized protein YndB with AHSA1/START domain
MTTKQNPPAGALCFYDLPSTNVAETQKFYAAAFNWKFADKDGYMFVNDGSPEGGALIMGGLRPVQDFDRGVGVLTYIAVDCLETTSKKIQAAGGKLVSPRVPVPGYGSFVVFQAPGGPTQAIWQAENATKPVATIHQEVVFDAPASKLYQALVDATVFTKLTGAPATGTPSEGATFTAFGGHVTGRNIELVDGKRVVQVWRAKTWPEGLYSIARFELRAEGSKTRLVFDHDGFPADMLDHLSAGWQANYWNALKKLEG